MCALPPEIVFPGPGQSVPTNAVLYAHHVNRGFDSPALRQISEVGSPSVALETAVDVPFTSVFHATRTNDLEAMHPTGGLAANTAYELVHDHDPNGAVQFTTEGGPDDTPPADGTWTMDEPRVEDSVSWSTDATDTCRLASEAELTWGSDTYTLRVLGDRVFETRTSTAGCATPILPDDCPDSARARVLDCAENATAWVDVAVPDCSTDTGDTSVPTDDADDGGCGCRTGSPASLFLFLPLLPALRRRR